MEIDKKSIKKMFPHLSKELEEEEESKVTIDSIRANPEEAEKDLAEVEAASADQFRHFNPDVVDFLRRCDTDAQAEEIIAYMEKRSELTKERAAELRTQLKKNGVRCFGPKKEENYYFKEGGIC